MAVAFRASRTGSVSSTTISTTMPAGFQAGDLLIAVAASSDVALNTFTYNGGGPWAQQQNTGGNPHVSVYTRIADGTEQDVQFNYLQNASLQTAIFAYSGVDAVSSTSAGSYPAGLPAATHTAPSLTPPLHNSWLFVASLSTAGTGTITGTPAGMTARLTHPQQADYRYFDEALPANLNATGTRSMTFSLSRNGAIVALLLRPTNTAPSAPGAFTTPTAGEVVNTTDLVTVGAASDVDGNALTYDFDLSVDNGASYTAKRVKAAGESFTHDYTTEPVTTTAKWRARAWDGTTYGPYAYSSTFTIQHNFAPNPATWVSPAAGATLDRAVAQRLDYDFNDPDPGDSQTKVDRRIRLQGAGTWTTSTATTASTFWDLAAGSLAAGNYEAQVLTYDSQGLAATDWSASLLFTLADAPGAPTITAPVSGGTIASSSGLIAWSIGTQQAFQVRKLADNVGAAADASVPANVYYDSGEVVSTTARDHALTFPVNSRYEHLQVRVKAAGLWSSWASIRVLVSFTPPAEPTITLTTSNATGSITVTPTHPAPTGSQPTVASLDVYRRVRAVGGVGVRIAAGKPASAAFTDYTPASGVDYEYQVQANGSNNTASVSQWVSASTAAAAPAITAAYEGGY